MEEEKKLYPLVLIPVEDPPGEIWHLADMGYPDSMIRDGYLSTDILSEVMDVYMDRIVGEKAFASFGRQFPVMLKTLKNKQGTPLLVHPDDETAFQRFDFLGKAKLWYVLSAPEGACLYLGFKADTAASDFYNASKDGSVRNLLKEVPVKPGNCFKINPGTVHAAPQGVEILEIAESSPLDFRIFNWGKQEGGMDPFDEELTLEAAFDFINYSESKVVKASEDYSAEGVRSLCDGPEFKAGEIRLSSPLKIDASQSGSFSAYYCLSGEAAVQVAAPGTQEELFAFAAGTAVIVPAEVEQFVLIPRQENTTLVELSI